MCYIYLEIIVMHTFEQTKVYILKKYNPCPYEMNT